MTEPQRVDWTQDAPPEPPQAKDCRYCHWCEPQRKRVYDRCNHPDTRWSDCHSNTKYKRANLECKYFHQWEGTAWTRFKKWIKRLLPTRPVASASPFETDVPETGSWR